MIIKLFGGPRDGKEIRIPEDMEEREIRFPESSVAVGYEPQPISRLTFLTSRYQPIRDELGDFGFVGYDC